MFVVGIILIVFGVVGMLDGEVGGGFLFIAVGAFLIYRAKKKKKKHEQPDKLPEPVKPATKVNVVGTFYHRDDIEKVLDPNPKMNKRGNWSEGEVIYHHAYFERPCQLVPEPDNPVDPNAIKVMYDGKMIGYIPEEETAGVRTRLQSNNLIPILTIRSGPYTIYLNGEYSDRDDANYSAFIEFR